MRLTTPDHEIQELVSLINESRPKGGVPTTEFDYYLRELLLEIRIYYDSKGEPEVVSVCRGGGSVITDEYVHDPRSKVETVWIRTGHQGEPPTLEEALFMHTSV